MKIKFLGTRGEIEEWIAEHKKHSAILLEVGNEKYLFDFGENNKGTLDEIKPNAVFLTHAHPDHAFGLEGEKNVKVHLTPETSELLPKEKFPFERELIRERVTVDSLRVEAVPVIHSLKAPAVGFVIETEGKRIGYFPDMIQPVAGWEKLRNLDLLIADASSPERDLVRRKDDDIYGHSSMRRILNKAKELNVKYLIFTHFGKESLKADPEDFENILPFDFAFDGFSIEFSTIAKMMKEVLQETGRHWIQEFHKEDYQVKKVNDRQLADDFRLVMAKYATMKEGGKTEFKNEEEIFEFAKGIVEEILHRKTITFHPQKMKKTSLELLSSCLDELIRPGIYLVPPHGELITSGEKTAIVKKRRFDLTKPAILVSGDYALGFIRCREPELISLEEFEKRRNEHKISEDEREEWWPGAKEFYFYKIRDFVPFAQRAVKVKPGIQGFINEVEFVRPKLRKDIIPTELSDEELIAQHGEIHREWESPEQTVKWSKEDKLNFHALISGEMKDRGLEHRLRFPLDLETQGMIRQLRKSEAKEIQEIRQVFGSPGGKHFVAKKIISYIPEHKIYVEPFAGGAAVFFAKKPSEKEVLNDIDSDIMFAYRYLKKGNFAGIDRLEWKLTENLWDRIMKENPDSEAKRFRKVIFSIWGTYGAKKDNFNPDNEGREWGGINRLPSFHDRLKDVILRNQDYKKTIKEFDSKDTFFYLDPPYPDTGIGLTIGEINLNELKETLKNLRGKFILSMNESSEIEKFFKNFEIKGIEVPEMLKGELSEKNKRIDFLISNFPLKKSNQYLLEAEDKISLSELLELWSQGFSLRKPFLALVGSLPVEGSGNDVDIWVNWDPEDTGFLESLAYRIKNVLPENIAERVHVFADRRGPFTSYLPLASLDVSFYPQGERKIIRMTEAFQNEDEARQSEKEDKVKPFRFYYPMKAIVGYRKMEVYSIEGLIAVLRENEWPYIVDQKFDGLRLIVHKANDKIQVYTEQGQMLDIKEMLPSFVEELKKIKHDFIIEGEGEIWVEGEHWGRSSTAGYINSKKYDKTAAEGFRLNAFDCLWFDGEDIHKKPLSERKKTLDKLSE